KSKNKSSDSKEISLQPIVDEGTAESEKIDNGSKSPRTISGSSGFSMRNRMSMKRISATDPKTASVKEIEEETETTETELDDRPLTGDEIMETLDLMTYMDHGWPVCDACEALVEDDMTEGRKDKGMWCSQCQKYFYQRNSEFQLHLDKNRIIWLKAIKNAPAKFQRIDPWE
ncbi:hypothetical protein, variant, partial [Sphaeroforma arctica JP610]